jgi:small-conductance mechanosensitive channel
MAKDKSEIETPAEDAEETKPAAAPATPAAASPSTKPLVEFDGKQVSKLQGQLSKFEVRLQDLVAENKQLREYVDTLAKLPGRGADGSAVPQRTLLDEIDTLLGINQNKSNE